MSSCGHKEAQCVIGNYWECKICETASESTMITASINKLVVGKDISDSPTILYLILYLGDSITGNKHHATGHEIFSVIKTKVLDIRWIVCKSDITGYKYADNHLWAKIKQGASMYREQPLNE